MFSNKDEEEELESKEKSSKLAENFKKAKKNERVKDFLRAVILFITAFIIYSVCVKILPDNMSFLVRHMIALIIGLLFLWGYNVAQKEKTETGKATVVFLFLFFVYNISSHYFITDSSEAAFAEGETQIGLQAKIIKRSGTYVFDLKAGEATGLMGFEEGRIADVTYSSPDYDYILNYSDGTSYTHRDNVPVKKHCYVNIVANTHQLVTMDVKYRDNM